MSCENSQVTRNSLDTAKSICRNNHNCYAVEQTQGKPRYCTVVTKKEGMVNLRKEEGKVVWIKKGKLKIIEALMKKFVSK